MIRKSTVENGYGRSANGKERLWRALGNRLYFGVRREPAVVLGRNGGSLFRAPEGNVPISSCINHIGVADDVCCSG